jgi:hypothetical protein
MNENILKLRAKLQGYQLQRFGSTSSFILHGHGKYYQFPTLAIVNDFLSGRLA